MPRINLEYSANMPKIDFQAYFKDVNAAVTEALQANLFKCKGRARCCDVYCVGDGNPEQGFVYVDILILEGRSKEMVAACVDSVREITAKYYAEPLQNSQNQLTLFIHEMAKENYLEFQG